MIYIVLLFITTYHDHMLITKGEYCQHHSNQHSSLIPKFPACFSLLGNEANCDRILLELYYPNLFSTHKHKHKHKHRFMHYETVGLDVIHYTGHTLLTHVHNIVHQCMLVLCVYTNNEAKM